MWPIETLHPPVLINVTRLSIKGVVSYNSLTLKKLIIYNLKLLLHLSVFSPFFLCFCLSRLQSAHRPVSFSEHRVVIIQSQSVHWTAAQTHLNSAHNHYYISVSLSLSKSLLCLTHLTPPPKILPPCPSFGSISHLCIRCISPSPSDNCLIFFSFLVPFSHTL